MRKENTQQEVTLIQALSEIYAYNQRKKRGAVICFEITFPGDSGKKEAILFGKRSITPLIPSKGMDEACWKKETQLFLFLRDRVFHPSSRPD